MKEKTLTIELSHENPLGDGYFYAMLELPAAEHEIRDAIQRARMVGREDSFRSIGILDCGAWPELLYYTDLTVGIILLNGQLIRKE